MLFRAGLWLFLLTCAGAYQSYNEANRVDFDEDTNYTYDSYDEPFKDLAMFKVINAVRKRGDELELLQSRPNDSRKDDSEGSRMERPLPEPKAKVKDVGVKPKTQKQSRWRIRRRPGLCLLKLCPPFYYIRQ